jgi:hypothetical protein
MAGEEVVADGVRTPWIPPPGAGRLCIEAADPAAGVVSAGTGTTCMGAACWFVEGDPVALAAGDLEVIPAEVRATS